MLVLKSALDQFGDVLSVEFIPNYIYPQGLSKAALVDMTSAIRACRAEATIFANRPRKPPACNKALPSSGCPLKIPILL